ncbi:MAG: prolyl-tRNA synthetase associated domain-containing protein [Alphaproteobacteria bacterium]|nr:prolyl-tRNA synthetase associated domain-containing protein [Alphaproteobacteria bacterium]
MSASPERKYDEHDLYALVESMGIPTTLYEHEPVFTVADHTATVDKQPGAQVKNLFLRDKKKTPYLLTAEHTTEVALKALKTTLGASGNLSFGSPELLWDTLGLKPGSVSPYGLINDVDRKVTFAIDSRLLEATFVNPHPLRNDRTLAMTPADLFRLLSHWGYVPIVLQFDAHGVPSPVAATA